MSLRMWGIRVKLFEEEDESFREIVGVDLKSRGFSVTKTMCGGKMVWCL